MKIKGNVMQYGLKLAIRSIATLALGGLSIATCKNDSSPAETTKLEEKTEKSLPFKSPIYENCEQDALAMATQSHQQFEERLKTLPKSMQLEQRGFYDVDIECFSQKSRLPAIVSLEYLKTPPKTPQEIKITVNENAVKEYGYEPLENGTTWNKNDRTPLAAVKRKHLQINPEGYQNHFYESKLTQNEAKCLAYNIDIHESIHLKQHKNPKLYHYNIPQTES